MHLCVFWFIINADSFLVFVSCLGLPHDSWLLSRCQMDIATFVATYTSDLIPPIFILPCINSPEFLYTSSFKYKLSSSLYWHSPPSPIFLVSQSLSLASFSFPFLLLPLAFRPQTSLDFVIDTFPTRGLPSETIFHAVSKIIFLKYKPDYATDSSLIPFGIWDKSHTF